MKYALPAAILIVMLSALAFTAVFAAEAEAGSSTATMSINGDDSVST